MNSELAATPGPSILKPERRCGGNRNNERQASCEDGPDDAEHPNRSTPHTEALTREKPAKHPPKFQVFAAIRAKRNRPKRLRCALAALITVTELCASRTEETHLGPGIEDPYGMRSGNRVSVRVHLVEIGA